MAAEEEPLNVKWIVELKPDERKALEALVSKGEVRARKFKRARVLLLADSTSREPIREVCRSPSW